MDAQCHATFAQQQSMWGGYSVNTQNGANGYAQTAGAAAMGASMSPSGGFPFVAHPGAAPLNGHMQTQTHINMHAQPAMHFTQPQQQSSIPFLPLPLPSHPPAYGVMSPMLPLPLPLSLPSSSGGVGHPFQSAPLVGVAPHPHTPTMQQMTGGSISPVPAVPGPNAMNNAIMQQQMQMNDMMSLHHQQQQQRHQQEQQLIAAEIASAAALSPEQKVSVNLD